MQISIGHAKNKIVSAAKKCLLRFCLRHATHAYVFESRSRLLQRLKGRCHDTQLSKVSWEWFPPFNLKGGMKDVKDSFSFKFATFLKSPRICKTRKKERKRYKNGERRERTKTSKIFFPFSRLGSQRLTNAFSEDLSHLNSLPSAILFQTRHL